MLNHFPRLMGTTLGFVAFGNIPRAAARRAKPFGFHMMAYDPYISELDMIKYGVEPITELVELLERSDFLLKFIQITVNRFNGFSIVLRISHFQQILCIGNATVQFSNG